MALLSAFMGKRPSAADAEQEEPPTKQQHPHHAAQQMTLNGVHASARSMAADIQALQEQAELLTELENPQKHHEHMALLISTGEVQVDALELDEQFRGNARALHSEQNGKHDEKDSEHKELDEQFWGNAWALHSEQNDKHDEKDSEHKEPDEGDEQDFEHQLEQETEWQLEQELHDAKLFTDRFGVAPVDGEQDFEHQVEQELHDAKLFADRFGVASVDGEQGENDNEHAEEDSEHEEHEELERRLQQERDWLLQQDLCENTAAATVEVVAEGSLAIPCEQKEPAWRVDGEVVTPGTAAVRDGKPYLPMCEKLGSPKCVGIDFEGSASRSQQWPCELFEGGGHQHFFCELFEGGGHQRFFCELFEWGGRQRFHATAGGELGDEVQKHLHHDLCAGVVRCWCCWCVPAWHDTLRGLQG
jgi:hypothetical protein